MEDVKHKPIQARVKAINKLQKRDNRGIQSFIRSLSKNHYTLLVSIDRKSRTIITVISLVLTLTIGVIMVQADDLSASMLLRHGILSLFCLVSLFYAIAAINPHKTHGDASLDAIRKGDGSFLYFGNFRHQSLKIYLEEMNEVMNNGQRMYDAMLKDIYYLGAEIAHRNRYLRISLLIFAVGMTISLALGIGMRIFSNS